MLGIHPTRTRIDDQLATMVDRDLQAVIVAAANQVLQDFLHAMLNGAIHCVWHKLSSLVAKRPFRRPVDFKKLVRGYSTRV